MLVPMVRLRSVLAVAGVGAGGALAGYLGLVSGAVPVDLGLGRRVRPLGPIEVDIAADRDVLFDVLSEPYLGRQTRAVADKIRILQRGTDMVLAEHRTKLRGRLVATTVETVRFDRPDRVEFYLTRGPVPFVTEQFALSPVHAAGPAGDGVGTRLRYTGELGTDLWAVGAQWGDVVAQAWERVVASTFAAVQVEAERRQARDRPA